MVKEFLGHKNRSSISFHTRVTNYSKIGLMERLVMVLSAWLYSWS